MRSGSVELRPREHEAEACAEERGDEPRHPSPSSTNAALIAVAMNTAVATKLALRAKGGAADSVARRAPAGTARAELR